MIGVFLETGEMSKSLRSEYLPVEHLENRYISKDHVSTMSGTDTPALVCSCVI